MSALQVGKQQDFGVCCECVVGIVGTCGPLHSPFGGHGGCDV